MKCRFLFSSMALSVLAACGASHDQAEQAFSISADNIAPQAWPLKISSLTIDCSLQPYVVGEHDGAKYAMTGSSIDKAQRDNTGWRSILDIALPNPEYPTIKMDISSVNEYAINECKKSGFWE